MVTTLTHFIQIMSFFDFFEATIKLKLQNLNYYTPILGENISFTFCGEQELVAKYLILTSCPDIKFESVLIGQKKVDNSQQPKQTKYGTC